MTWADHAVFWHTYPLGLGAAPIRDHPTPGHRLRALTERLDHVAALGATALLLGPIAASLTHGYDTIDHFRIDPRLGDDRDFDELVAGCRERGLRLVLDGVFSHVARGHAGPLALDAQGRPEVFEGHGDLLRLDHSDPGTADLVAAVMNHWCDRGVDGWRLDAAYSVDPAFWATVTPRVRQRHPDAWILGEVIHGDYAGFVRDAGIDSVTQYELWKAIRSCIHDANLFELDWALRRHNDLLETFVPQTFIGNHDVTRIASAVGRPGAVVALAILMCVSGIPSIYYGDEIGLTGVKEQRLGGDDAVRPAWPTTSDPAAHSVFRAHSELIGLRNDRPWLPTARTELVDLTNTRAVLRSTARKGDGRLDLELELSGRPSAIVRDANGTVCWSSPTAT